MDNNMTIGEPDDVFARAEEYETQHPDVATAMRLLGVSLEQYEASLAALYSPRCVTTSSTETLHANMG